MAGRGALCFGRGALRHGGGGGGIGDAGGAPCWVLLPPGLGRLGPNVIEDVPGGSGSRCRGGAGLGLGEAGSDPRGHLGVTWGVYLCAGKPPLADIILSHPPELTRCDSVIGFPIPAMSGHIQNRGTASGDLYIGISGINRVLLS